MIKKYKNKAAIFLCVAITYFLFTLPQIDLIFQVGRSTIRLSGFLPIVFGLLFGPIGAVACSIGNYASDSLGTLGITDLVGSFGVFVMAYMPYRLWHRLFLSAKSHSMFFDSAASVLKFIFITIISSVSATAVGSIGGQLSGQYSFFGFFPQVFLQYFNFSIILGMFVLQILNQYVNIMPCRPKNAYKTESQPKQFWPDYLLCALIILLSCALLLCTQDFSSFDSPFIRLLCIFLFILILLLMFLPSSRRGKPTAERKPHCATGSLQRQLVTGFLSLQSVLLLFYSISMIIIFQLHSQGNSKVVVWTSILLAVALGCVVLVSVLSLLLLWIERYLVKPLGKISTYATQFVHQDSLSEQELILPKTRNEIDELGRSLVNMTTSIRQYTLQLTEKTAIEERHHVEMSTARTIQMGLLLKDWQLAKPFELAATTKPAQEVGGDFYDYSRISNHQLFVAIADVSGKGISAALFMMRANALLRSHRFVSVANMITTLNQKLSEQNDSMMFVTVFAGLVDRKEMTFHYVNAGHNPALIYQDGALFALDTPPNLAVGPMETTHYTEHSLPISQDFHLLLYTDGVTEAENKNGEFFGMQRLLAVAQNNLGPKIDCQSTIDTIEQEVLRFADGAKQADDITMLCLSLGDSDAHC